jgi:hypothetical protein
MIGAIAVIIANIARCLSARLGEAPVAMVHAGLAALTLPKAVAVALAHIGAVAVVDAKVVAVHTAPARVATAGASHGHTDIAVVKALVPDPAHLFARARVTVPGAVEGTQIAVVTFNAAGVVVAGIQRWIAAHALLGLQETPFRRAVALVLAAAQVRACVPDIKVLVALV